MPIIVTEDIGSRTLTASRDGKASSIDFLLTVRGSMDQVAVKNAATAFVPDVWGTGSPQFYKQTVNVECVGEDVWKAFVHFDTTAPEPFSANNSFEFDIGGGTQHITQALATTAYPSTLPDHEGAIGVTSDGEVTGADIYTPEMSFVETYYFQELSNAQKRAMVLLKSHVNNAPFKGWEAGEVLFVGATARRQDNRFSTPWSVTYRFAVQHNAIVDVGAVEGIPKLGWQLLDIRHRQVAGSTSMLRVAEGAYVHTVYAFGDFSLLGIGV